MGTQHWDQSCDVLVVGTGAGGMTAAIVAADSRADTIIIEKGARYGGTSATSGGVLWIPGSHLAEAAGHANSAADAYTYMRAIGGEEVDDEQINAFISNAPRMLKYMEENTEVRYVSIPYPDYRPDIPGAALGWRSHDCVPLDGRLLGAELEALEPPHPSNLLMGRYVWNTVDASKLVTRTPGWIGAMRRTLWRYYSDVGQRVKSRRSRYLTGGNALIARLKLSLDKRKVPLWLKTRLVELVQEDGCVSGVIVERGGRRMAIGVRRAVILASGGFEASAKLRAEHLAGSTDTAWTGSQENNVGDGLVAAQALGADVARMDSAWRAPALHVPGETRARPIFFERALPGSIVVNQAGCRYMNEAADYHMAGQAMIDNDRPGAGTSPSFMIFDALYKWRYPLGPVLPMLPVRLLPKGVRSLLIQADSIAALAGRLGIDPEALTGTVERFNAHARDGHDPDFHRGEGAYDRLFGDQKLKLNPNLMPLEKAPFYAVALYPGDIGTNGGVVTNGNAAVMNGAGKPIRGLYAVGNVAASPMGRSYPGGGATLGAAMTGGYVAARHAMGVN